MDIALLKAIVTALTTLITMVTGLQADVDHLKANANNINFGAVSVLTSPVIVDGVSTYYYRQTMRQATSSLAIFKTPAATTTLESLACSVGNGNTYSNTYQAHWAAVAWTKTTLVAQRAFNGNGAFAATTTKNSAFGTGQDGIFPPSSFVNVSLSTTTAVSLAPVGSCTLTLRVI